MKIKLSGKICIFDDDADISNLSACTQPNGYSFVVYSSGPNKTRRYARVYMNCPHGLEVDHINGNPLDNRRDNLRIATPQQNKFNTKSKSKKGLPKGVEQRGDSFRVTITINYSKYNLGTYPTVQAAEEAYNRKAAEYFGIFAKHLSGETE